MRPLVAREICIAFAVCNIFSHCGTRELMYQSKHIYLILNKLFIEREKLSQWISQIQLSTGKVLRWVENFPLCKRCNVFSISIPL